MLSFLNYQKEVGNMRYDGEGGDAPAPAPEGDKPAEGGDSGDSGDKPAGGDSSST